MSDTERDDGSDRTIFSTIPAAIEEIRLGRMVLVVDDADRENEGDFVMAAEACTPEAVNFMVTHWQGHRLSPVRGVATRRARYPTDGDRHDRRP